MFSNKVLKAIAAYDAAIEPAGVHARAHTRNDFLDRLNHAESESERLAILPAMLDATEQGIVERIHTARATLEREIHAVQCARRAMARDISTARIKAAELVETAAASSELAKQDYRLRAESKAASQAAKQATERAKNRAAELAKDMEIAA